MEKAPEYTELEKQRIKERFDALTPEQKERVMKAFKSVQEPKSNPTSQVKDGIATLTYKQLAQNYNKEENKKHNGKKIKVETTIRKLVRNMNKEKTKIRIVNKPGTVLNTKEGSFIITKKGKSIRIGD